MGPCCTTWVPPPGAGSTTAPISWWAVRLCRIGSLPAYRGPTAARTCRMYQARQQAGRAIPCRPDRGYERVLMPPQVLFRGADCCVPSVSGTLGACSHVASTCARFAARSRLRWRRKGAVSSTKVADLLGGTQLCSVGPAWHHHSSPTGLPSGTRLAGLGPF